MAPLSVASGVVGSTNGLLQPPPARELWGDSMNSREPRTDRRGPDAFATREFPKTESREPKSLDRAELRGGEETAIAVSGHDGGFATTELVQPNRFQVPSRSVRLLPVVETAAVSSIARDDNGPTVQGGQGIERRVVAKGPRVGSESPTPNANC